MNIQILSRSYVSVWKNPRMEFPGFNQKFCLDLFDDYTTTQFGLSPDGFVIQKNTPPGTASPRVCVGPARLLVMHDSLKNLTKVMKALYPELARWCGEREGYEDIKAFAINTEIVVTGLPDTASAWIGNRYVRPGLAGIHAEPVDVADLRFQVKSDDFLCRVAIQPRFNDDRALFVELNDHTDDERKLHDPDEVEHLVTRSESRLSEIFVPMITGEL
jgi:hypothetical protein